MSFSSHPSLWGALIAPNASLHPLVVRSSPLHALVHLTSATLVPQGDSALSHDTIYFIHAHSAGNSVVLASLKAPACLSRSLNFEFSVSSNVNFSVSSLPPMDLRCSVQIAGFSKHSDNNQTAAIQQTSANAAVSAKRKADFDSSKPSKKSSATRPELAEDIISSEESEEEKRPKTPASAPPPKSPASSEKEKSPRVRQFPNGLRFDEVTPGSGKEATKNSRVAVRYKGEFLNGRVFDSNMPRGAPLKFRIGAGEVVKGFELGALGMRAGGTRIVTIPPQLGYGARGAPPDIPPNATLKFTLQLVKVD